MMHCTTFLTKPDSNFKTDGCWLVLQSAMLPLPSCACPDLQFHPKQNWASVIGTIWLYVTLCVYVTFGRCRAVCWELLSSHSHNKKCCMCPVFPAVISVQSSGRNSEPRNVMKRARLCKRDYLSDHLSRHGPCFFLLSHRICKMSS